MDSAWSKGAIIITIVITAAIGISIYALTGNQSGVQETCGNTCLVEQQDSDSFKSGKCNCVMEKTRQPQWNNMGYFTR
jgi:hypothetical protein